MTLADPLGSGVVSLPVQACEADHPHGAAQNLSPTHLLLFLSTLYLEKKGVLHAVTSFIVLTHLIIC